MDERRPQLLLRTYLAFTFGITWAVWLPRAMVSHGWFDSEFVAALGGVWTYGPAVAAVLAAWTVGGRTALRALGSRVVRWRVGWQPYALAVGLPIVMAVGATLISTTFTGELPSGWFVEGGVTQLVILLIVLTLTDGVGEEVGWRGVALPSLLTRLRAFPASLALGVVWATWHLPLAVTEGSHLQGWTGLLLFLQLPATAVLYTWLFRRAHGSVLIAVLFHGALNTSLLATPPAAASRLAVANVLMHWFAALALVAATGLDLDGRRRRGDQHRETIPPSSERGNTARRARGAPT